MIAHEAIFEMRCELVARDRSDPRHVRLLEESARIVTVELPDRSATARQLVAKWEEQSLLDPEGAADTLAVLEAELACVVPRIRPLLDRQREIAAELLRSMLKR
jgi:hypothetical protein